MPGITGPSCGSPGEVIIVKAKLVVAVVSVCILQQKDVLVSQEKAAELHLVQTCRRRNSRSYTKSTNHCMRS